jgi:hypothetical protein
MAAIVAIDRDAQLLRRYVGQRWDVVSHFALADQGAYFFKNLVQQRLHERPWLNPLQTSVRGRMLDED